MDLHETLRITRGRFAPHYYKIARPAGEDKYKVVRKSPSGRGLEAKIRYRQQQICKDLTRNRSDRFDEALPEAPDVSASYGAWVAPENIMELWDEAERLAEINYDRERAQRQMSRELKKRNIMGPVQRVEFGNKRRIPGFEGDDYSQRFEIEHESGEVFSGVVKSLFDAGTIVSFDHQDGASWSQDSLTEPEKECARAVKYSSDIPTRVRL